MRYSISFDPKVLKTMGKWKKSNPLVFKKLTNILQDITQHPRTGIGHPEPLKGGNDVTYSRRLTAHDRVIYDIYDDTVCVMIIEVEGHYDDK